MIITLLWIFSVVVYFREYKFGLVSGNVLEIIGNVILLPVGELLHETRVNDIFSLLFCTHDVDLDDVFIIIYYLRLVLLLIIHSLLMNLVYVTFQPLRILLMTLTLLIHLLHLVYLLIPLYLVVLIS